MNKNLLVSLGVFLAVIAAGAFFWPKPKVGGVKTSPSSLASPVAEGGVREITVLGNEYSFSPANLSVVKGEKIRLTFVNAGSQFHNLVISELGVKTKTVAGGKSDTVEFTPTASGTFNFFCGIGDHQSLGMEGKLQVE